MENLGIKIVAFDEASSVIQKVGDHAQRLGSTVGAMGTSFRDFATAALAGLSAFSFATKVKDVVDLGDSLNKLAQKTGIAVEALSQLKYAAAQSDISTESLAMAIKKLNLAISAAASGSDEKAAIFKAMGINIRDASGAVLSADKVFAAMADRFSESADGANKTAVAVALLGKNGADLVPMLNLGGTALADLGNEAKKLGIVMGSDFAKNAEEFNDNLRRVKLSGEGLFITLAGDLVKGIGDTASEMARAAIEGGKLAGVIAGIQTLLTGTDQYKNDKALVEQTEQLLRVQSQLDKLKAGGAPESDLSLQRARLELAGIQSLIENTRAYRSVLQGIAEDREKALKPKPTDDSAAIKAAAAAAARAGAGTAVESEYVRINKLIGGRLALTSEELDAGRALTEQEKFRVKILDDVANATGKLSNAQRANIAASLDEIDAKDLALRISRAQIAQAKEAATERQKLRNADYESVGKFAQAELEANNASTRALKDGNASLREEIATIGLSEAALVAHQVALIDDTIAEKGAEIARLAAIGVGVERAEQLRTEVDLLKERRGLIALKGDAAIFAEAARKTEDEWRRAADNINQSLTDALMRGFESGKDMAANLRDTVINMFKTMVLRPVISAVMNPMALALTGTMGMAGAANAAGAGASMSGAWTGLMAGGGMVGNMASIAGGIYGGVGELSSLTLGEAITSGFASLGSGTMSGFLAGSQTIVAALGPIALGIAALVAIGRATSGEMRAGGQYGYSFNGTDVLNNRRGTSVGANGVGAVYLEGPSGGDFYAKEARAAINGTVASINATLKAFGSQASLVGFQAGYETSADNRGGVLAGGTLSTGKTFGQSGAGDNYAGTLYDASKGFNMDAKEAAAAFALELQQSVIEAIQASDLPQYLVKVFAGLDASTMSADDIAKTLAFASSLKTVRDALTETREPMQVLQDTVAEGMKSLGTSAENFKRDFVAAIDAGITPETLAQWQALSGAMSNLDKAVADLAAGMNRSLGSIMDSRFDLENQLLNLQGNAAQAAANISAKELAKLTEGLTPEQAAKVKAEFDYNEGLKAQVKALQDAQAAAKDYASAQQQAASAAAQAASEQARAAQQVRDAWQSVVNGIVGEVARIRGLIVGNGADGYAMAQAKFNIALAQARAGDQDAARNLSGMSQNMLGLAESNATTLTELQLIRARTAGQLEDLGLSLTGQYDLAPMTRQDDPIVTELRAVKAEMVAQRAEMVALRAETQSSAESNKTTAKTLVRLMPDGDALTVRVAA